MTWLFVMDPLGALKLAGDTSLAIVEAALDRGMRVLATTVTELGWESGGPIGALAAEITRCEPLAGVLEHGPFEAIDAATVDLALMRKDPPFDIEYIYATYILEELERRGVAVVNGPRGLRACNEKVYGMRFPDLYPPSLLARAPARVSRYVQECGGRAVCKPLDLMGGRRVILLRSDDPNLSQLIEMSTDGGRRRVIVQRYVEEAEEGDKRILLVDGDVVGAFVRTPPEGDFRGNLSVGATASRGVMTARDEEIIARLRPELEELGHRFVGIDVIGPWLTEVNVTSPMGLREIDALEGGRSADRVVEALLR